MKQACYLFFLLLPAISQAQEGKFSLYVNAGFFSSFNLQNKTPHATTGAQQEQHFCPVLNTGFLVDIGDKWRAGPGFSYDHFGDRDRHTEHSILSYYLRGDRLWHETEKLAIYSGVSLGVSVRKKLVAHQVLEKKTVPCLQLNLVGTEFRFRKFSLDLNLGFGVSGMVSGGMKYHF